MASTVTLFQNTLPTSLGQEVSWKPPSAAPLANRQLVKLPPSQGSNFKGTGGTTLTFRIPSINKLLDTAHSVKFGFKLSLGDKTKMHLPEGAASIIRRISVQTAGNQQLEDLDYYNLWSRIQSNITVPEYLKSGPLGISQGYGENNSDGHYEVPLHSMILSNAKCLPLKQLGGLILTITIEDANVALITTDSAATPYYELTEAYISFETLDYVDGQKMEFDNAFRGAGGVMLTGRSWSLRQPQFTNPTGSIVIVDRHSSQSGFLLAFRNNVVINSSTAKGEDSFQLAKPIDSVHVKNGGETLSQMPITFKGTDVCEAFGMVLSAYGNHCLGERLNKEDFSDPLGKNNGHGSFVVAQTLETSSLVSGSSQARRSGVDIEVVTTGDPTTENFSCVAFVSYNQVISWNVDGTVDVYN
jgi:hypothetical protein